MQRATASSEALRKNFQSKKHSQTATELVYRLVLSLLVLPLVVPVVLAAAEATRLIAEDDVGDQWRRWAQFLGTFAIVFVTAGIFLFGVAVEE